ncbi:MAG: hypothetical protein KGH65_04695 [Candidatus Micrarchaeota archaeon]|nr:hypothetical protein [Candidatus Micrarchaeota archaeon]
MKIFKSKGKTVLVASGLGSKCPRMVANGPKANFRDDYKGSIMASKKLTRKLFS